MLQSIYSIYQLPSPSSTIYISRSKHFQPCQEGNNWRTGRREQMMPLHGKMTTRAISKHLKRLKIVISGYLGNCEKYEASKREAGLCNYSESTDWRKIKGASATGHGTTRLRKDLGLDIWRVTVVRILQRDLKMDFRKMKKIFSQLTHITRIGSNGLRRWRD